MGHVTQVNRGVDRQRGHVGEIGDVGEPENGRVHRGEIPVGGGMFAGRDGVFLVDEQIPAVGQDAQHRTAHPVFELFQPRFQKTRVAAKLVDQKSSHPVLFLGGEQIEGSFHPGEHTAAVDVSHDEDRGLGHFRHGHVDQVPRLEIDFRGTAGAFEDHEVVPAAQILQRVLNGLPVPVVLGVVIPGVSDPHGAAHDDDLGSVVAERFQENGIHRHVGGQAAGLGLVRLGAPDFPAVLGHESVEGHVLRLERSHPPSLQIKMTAEGGGQQAFAHAGTRSLDH